MEAQAALLSGAPLVSSPHKRSKACAAWLWAGRQTSEGCFDGAFISVSALLSVPTRVAAKPPSHGTVLLCGCFLSLILL